VKLTQILILPVVVAALCAGCEKAATKPASETNAAASANLLPSGPQPKLQTMKIYLARMLGHGTTETLDAELALTPAEEETGLMYRTNITDETAMLFVLPAPERASFWMTNCPMSLSAAYIGPDGVIEEIHHLEKNDSNPVFSEHGNIQYVLEVNDGWFDRHNIYSGTLIHTDHGSLAETFQH
jgi:uncharacterized membrane protein (UPF0127 family)